MRGASSRSVMIPTRRAILASARAVVAGTAVLLACACGSSRPIEVGSRYEPEHGAATAIRVVVASEHRWASQRYVRAAVQAVRTLTEAVGAFGEASLTLADAAVAPARRPAGAIVLEPTPWWMTSGAMIPELAAARAVARRYWSRAIDASALPATFVDGLVEYYARRTVVPLFEADANRPGFAFLEIRYFGGFVPHSVSIREMPESDREPLARGDVEDAAIARATLTLMTAERWLGRPVFDGAMAAFVGRSQSRAPTLADFEGSLSAAAAQDLSWLFAPALDGAARFDYAVATLESVAGAGDYVTTVVVARLGDGEFTGSSRPRVGPFESGRGVALAVTFTDGTTIHDVWDGRDRTKTFAYRSPAPAASAIVDPDRVIVLDRSVTNNSMAAVSHAARAARRWSARWAVWFENVLMTYVCLV